MVERRIYRLGGNCLAVAVWNYRQEETPGKHCFSHPNDALGTLAVDIPATESLPLSDNENGWKRDLAGKLTVWEQPKL